MNPLSIQIAFSGKTRQFTLSGPSITIGSAPNCTLVLPFPWIAPKHLEIEHGLLLSRVRSGTENSPATLDGYPITSDWSLLPRHGLIEIPSPMGAKLAIAVDLEPVAVAAVTPAAPVAPPPPQVPFTAPMHLSVRSDRAAHGGGLLMKYIPLAIAALLLLGIIVVLFVISGQKPAATSVGIVTPPAPTSTPPTSGPSSTEENPATEPAEAPTPATAPASAPVVVAPPAAEVKPEPPPRVFRRRQVATAPASGPPQYALLEEETRSLLRQPTTAPLPSDILRTHAYDQVKQAVSAQLKNAAGIQFPELDSGQVIINFHDGVYIARGPFESLNNAGVPIRQAFYCRLRPTKSGWEIEQTEIFSR
jgi:hypothetical protein